jgi:hypothetical protein
MRAWLTAILAAFALFTATVPLVGGPPRAHADQSAAESADRFYIDLLKGHDVYKQYSKQALLQEGHKVCSATRHGVSEDDATNIVQSDLGISNLEAYNLVTSAELGLGCFSVKIHEQ